MSTSEAAQSKLFGETSQKRSRHTHRLPSYHLPNRLQVSEDTQEDVTAPLSQGQAPAQYMNQSIFGMIAAAGSRTDFNQRFDESSDSGEDNQADSGQNDLFKALGRPEKPAKVRQRAQDTKAGKSIPSHKPMRSPTRAPKTPLRGLKGGVRPTREQHQDTESDDEVNDPQYAPMMSRLLTAEVEYEAKRTKAVSAPASSSENTARIRSTSSPATLLATRLQEIFGFKSPEDVLAEFPCWLLQSVLLQGYLYLTRYHICFYAYLPKKSNVPSKTGYLSRKGKSTGNYRRYWFELKGDVLTYFSDPAHLYFPRGNIDLRYGISALLFPDSNPESTDFCVTTDHRSYYFRAESSANAKEWVRTIQKTIFRSHNDSDSVKITLPLDDVIDIEDSPVVDFAETIKVRMIENDDTFAIDEYFFSFSFGNDVMRTLRGLFDDAAQRRSSALGPVLPTSGTKVPNSDNTMMSAQCSETIRSTRGASQAHSPQPISNERSSADTGLKTHLQTTLTPAHAPSHSRASSMAPVMQEGLDLSPPLSALDADMSASQILSRSDVFRAPVLQRMSTLVSDDTENEDEDADIGPDRLSKSSYPQQTQTRVDAATKQDLASKLPQRTSSPILRDLVKAGTYPLQRAGAFAGYLKNTSERMSKLFATESYSYLDKVSGMWAGQRKHYSENEKVLPDDQDVDPEDDEANVPHGDRFRAHFALSSHEKLQATYFGFLHRVLPLYGKIYISTTRFCFRSLLPGTRTKLILPLRDIENVDKEKGFRLAYYGLVLVIKGHEELFFEFSSVGNRDDCTVTLFKRLESIRHLAESGLLSQLDAEAAEAARIENFMLQEARAETGPLVGSSIPENVASLGEKLESTVLFDDGRASMLSFKPPPGLRITCLTIGSRGDVQPYIALCKALLAEGHKPRIATHAEFGPWIKKHGIGFVSVGGDPAELMRICVENGMFTYSFLKEATSKFRTWIDDLLESSWQACQDSDILIESPSAMAGIHIAEALCIPYFRAFTMPWTRTRAYPHAFAVPEHKYGGAYNYLSYVMFDNVFWKGISGQINRWRRKTLKLESTNLERMQQSKVPFLYNYSPHVVPPPLDYSDWVRVTGYWFLDEGGDYKPPADLLAFIRKARADAKKLVYIGFGSIVVADPAALTRTVVEAVSKADVRCILSKGWSDRLGDPSAQKVEISLPTDLFQIKAAPHDWLFQQIDAAVHHGGAGTTGASLRAGIPTITKPFFGDQYFFGSRLEDLGVGICLKRINVAVLARAIWEAVHSERMITKARKLGEQIRGENGVQKAIDAIYRDLEYAQTLIRARQSIGRKKFSASDSNLRPTTEAEQYTAEEEESWTFVEQ